MISTEHLKVVLYDASSSGGVCHYTHQLAGHLAQLGHEVTLLTNEGYELSHIKKQFKTYFLFKASRVSRLLRSVIAWVKRFRLPEGRGVPKRVTACQTHPRSPSPFTFFRLLRLSITFLRAVLFLTWHRPQVIHFQWLIDHNYEYYFARILKALHFKIIYTAHDLLPQENSTAADRTARGRVYRMVDRLIVHSNGDKTKMTKVFRVDPEKIFVIPHGSNEFFYAPGGISKEAMRRDLGIALDKLVILFFGFIRRYKGLEYLTEAFKEVRVRVPNAMLLIVGAIYKDDSEGYKYYADLLEQLRGDESIRCISDYVPVEKVHAYFLASDLVVLPYVETYTSGVLLTAYAAGRPVVVTDTGGLSEVVEEGKTGYVVPPKDVKSLAAAIVEVVSNSERREAMGRFARGLAETNYSWRTVAAETARVYLSSINGAQQQCSAAYSTPD